MDNINYTTEHKKGQHLTSEERHEIEVRLKDGWTIYKIAKHLCRPYNTIKNEINRGTVYLYHNKIKRYKSDIGKAVYLEHRKNSRRNYRCLETSEFLRYVVKKFKECGWSLDACVGYALESGMFKRNEIVCTKTLYNYVDAGLLLIRNIDLPEKLSRNTKANRVRKNRRNLGKSITGDNGLEFLSLSEFENMGIPVYFTHPYTSCEKGTNECHNKMLRRFIPKGKSINDYSADDILYFSDIINNLPRKILNYHTPEELFEKQLDEIYKA